MIRTLLVAASLASLAGCVSIEVNESVSADAALSAFQTARVRECPSPAAAPNVTPTETVGVTSVDIAFTPLASDATRVVRLRRLTVAPRGSIGWHQHITVQGMALIVFGEIVEHRASCAVPVLYRAGDVAIEDVATEHAWVNTTDEPVIVLTAHVIPRP
ncbi:MAG: cupin domain-containing protein [Hyphomonadaceae bacterium]